ncbi:MAG: outer membrane lipoprotein-sorting protein [Treponema sp.]|jgi:hypothetical protein|nr:outer membrane lipoprotein-sorting protein [Treponema sp.]
MKKFCVFVALIVIAALARAQDGADIIRAARDRIRSDTMSSRSRMVITAKNGSLSERVIDQYSKDGDGGRSRSVIVFQSPATVRGTRFLTIDNPSGSSDQWIFLPGIGKVRRIAASESGGSFMGTDFSYDDMSVMDRDPELDDHSILREEELEGAPCYVVQSLPRDKNFSYSKSISWIDKAVYRVYRREMYNRRGALEKTMEMSGYRDVQGRDTPMETKVSTPAAGTFTTIYMDIVKYDDPIPEGVFTTAYLETGRVR